MSEQASDLDYRADVLEDEASMLREQAQNLRLEAVELRQEEFLALARTAPQDRLEKARRAFAEALQQ